MPSRRERREKRTAETKLLYIQAFPGSATAEAAARAAHKKAQRQQCIQEIILFQKSQRVVKSLAQGALPVELVLMVMQKLVKLKAPITDLELSGSTTCLRKKLLGDSASSASLKPVFFEALLKSSLIGMDLAFWRPGRAAQFLTTLPCTISHLVIYCDGEIWPLAPYERKADYPISIIRATRAMFALQAHAPAIKSLTLDVRLAESNYWAPFILRTGPFLEKPRVTVGKVMEDLMESVIGIPTLGRKMLRGIVVHQVGIVPTWAVKREVEVNGGMTAEEMLRAAFVAPRRRR